MAKAFFAELISGSIQRTTSDLSYLMAGPNISITTGSNNQITIDTQGSGGAADANATYVVLAATGSLSSERVLTAGTGITLTDGGAGSTETVAISNSIVATLSGSTYTGVVNLNAGASGSITKLTDGRDYIAAGTGVSITSASNGQIIISVGGGGGGASADQAATFIVMAATSSLPNERVLTAGTGITRTDGGAGGNVTIAINNSEVATLSGSTYTGVVNLNAGASGSITKLTNGNDFLIAGTNISIVSQSNGQITISSTGGTGGDSAASYIVLANTSSLSNERALTAGTGITLTDGGAGSTITTAINNSVVATTSGSTFTGVVNLNAGASGSITKLTDGRDYIAAGTNITITSASNGAITISSTANTGSVDNSGTTFVSWTINTDATASLLENPATILVGGDGVAAPNNDLVRSTFALSSSMEVLTFYSERNRNNAGFTILTPLFQIGKTGDTSTDGGGIKFAAEEFFLGGGDHGSIGQDSIALGASASCQTGESIVIGVGATSSGSANTNAYNIVLGRLATLGSTAGSRNILVGGNGSSISANLSDAILIGDASSTTTGNSISIGASNTNTTLNNSIVIGRSSGISQANTIVVSGQNGNASGPNQCNFGGSAAAIANVYLGANVSNAAPPDNVTYTVTGGSGSNIAATNMIIAGGRPTGTGTGGTIIIQTPASGAAATTQNTSTTRYTITGRTGLHTIDLVNNKGTAFLIREGNQDYWKVDTNNNAGQTPSIIFGASSSMPDISMRGNSVRFMTHRTTGSEEMQMHTTGFTTTDNTEVTFWSYTLSQTEAMHIEASVMANNASDSASYTRIATARRDTGGSAEIIGVSSSVHTAEAAALTNANVIIDASGNDVRVRITGITGAELNWLGWIKHQHQIK